LSILKKNLLKILRRQRIRNMKKTDKPKKVILSSLEAFKLRAKIISDIPLEKLFTNSMLHPFFIMREFCFSEFERLKPTPEYMIHYQEEDLRNRSELIGDQEFSGEDFFENIQKFLNKISNLNEEMSFESFKLLYKRIVDIIAWIQVGIAMNLSYDCVIVDMDILSMMTDMSFSDKICN